MNAYIRQARPALLLLVLLTLILGVAYPAVVLGVGQVVAPAQANGSLVSVNGKDAASSLLAQALPEKDTTYFWPRPSSVSWDSKSSGASNLALTSKDLADAQAKARKEVAAREGVQTSEVPLDAVTASASGLDPDISPAYAALQVPRVARATGLSQVVIRGFVKEATSTSVESFLGQEAVNTTVLNTLIQDFRAHHPQGQGTRP